MINVNPFFLVVNPLLLVVNPFFHDVNPFLLVVNAFFLVVNPFMIPVNAFMIVVNRAGAWPNSPVIVVHPLTISVHPHASIFVTVTNIAQEWEAGRGKLGFFISILKNLIFEFVIPVFPRSTDFLT